MIATPDKLTHYFDALRGVRFRTVVMDEADFMVGTLRHDVERVLAFLHDGRARRPRIPVSPYPPPPGSPFFFVIRVMSPVSDPFWCKN